MRHAFISPIAYFDKIPSESKFHICLVHLLKIPAYREFYQEEKRRGAFIILDNGAFELKTPWPITKIVELCQDYEFYPDVLILPDYPFESSFKTVDSTFAALSQIARGIVTWPCQFMAVPQSEAGDWKGWLDCYKVLSDDPRISWIGMSILSIPNAFSVVSGTLDVSFNRTFATSLILQRGIVGKVRHHYLGCDSPREIEMMVAQGVAYSNDSSTAIWHGHLGVSFDSTASGLAQGKSKIEVDFEASREDKNLHIIDSNVAYIQQLAVSLSR